MTKSQLIARLFAKYPQLLHRDVARIVNTIFDTIADALANGQRVEIRGFGSFFVQERDARLGRNPRTGEAVQVEEKFVPRFKVGGLLTERMQNGYDDDPSAGTS